jgi:Tfp pilus assembly protein PilV
MTGRLTRTLRPDSGVTLIEVMIASGLMILIMTFVLNMMDSASKNERGQEARHTAQLALRGAMDQITKDVRQATAVSTSSTTSLLDMQTLVNGNLVRVRYDVSGTAFRRTVCTSTDLATTCTDSPLVLISHFSGTPFCFDPPDCVAQSISTNPPTIRVTLAADPAVYSGGPITLQTDVDLRNAEGLQ